MGMPVCITIVDKNATDEIIKEIFSFFTHIDETFSTYKKTSEISKINSGLLTTKTCSKEVKEVLQLCDKTKRETHGYFDAMQNDYLDPSGLVKGYAIYQATKMLQKKGFKNFSVEIAGDVQVQGLNSQNKPWRIGIENPFQKGEIIKVVALTNKGIATSGTYNQGLHIYNPIGNAKADDIAGITVIGNNIYDADRFATAAFAMGKKGIAFLETLEGFEGYMVTKEKRAIYTSGFEHYVI